MKGRIWGLIRWHLYPTLYHFCEHALDNHVYTTRCGLTRGLKRKGGLSFIPGIIKFTKEHDFLTELDLRGKTIFDIGAAYGDFTLFFAQTVGENGMVVAFEPNPKLCRRIRAHVSLNSFEKNVMVKQLAVGDEKKIETLVFPTLTPGVGTIEKHHQKDILASRKAETISVELNSIDNLVEKLPLPDFIKIDVQGVELSVLYGMAKTLHTVKPDLFVEVHSIPFVDWRKENTLKIIEFLTENSYSIYHVESERAVDLQNYHIVNEDDHLYCFWDKALH